MSAHRECPFCGAIMPLLINWMDERNAVGERWYAMRCHVCGAQGPETTVRRDAGWRWEMRGAQPAGPAPRRSRSR